jgi:hypothetical protein
LALKGESLRRQAIRIPESFVHDSRLELSEAMQTKSMVDRILRKMLECNNNMT